MEWRVPNCIGAGWQPYYYDCFTVHFQRWTGDLSLWMIFVGSFDPQIATHSHRHFLLFWWHSECLLVGRKTVLSEINTWLGFVINPAGPFVQLARDKHVIVLALLKDLAAGKIFSSKPIEKALGEDSMGHSHMPSGKTVPSALLAVEVCL